MSLSSQSSANPTEPHEGATAPVAPTDIPDQASDEAATTPSGPSRLRRGVMAAMAVGVVSTLAVAGCGSSSHSASVSGASGNGPSASTGQSTSADQPTAVNITLTPQGCVPQPATVTTGDIQFNVSNKNAGAVSEAELRTSNLSHLLGEQENLTPGLSGGFELTVEPGDYVINCPGAHQAHAPFTVTGNAKTVSAADTNTLNQAVAGIRHLRQPADRAAGVVEPDHVQRHHDWQHGPSQGRLPEGPHLLRADRAGRLGVGHARYRHRRPD